MLRRQHQERCVIHGNVPGFHLSILEDLLGDLYLIISCALCPTQYGWPISRRRRITILLLRPSVLDVLCPYGLFTAACQRSCETYFVKFAVATVKELAEEYLWSRELPTSISKLEVCKWTSVVPGGALRFLSGYMFHFWNNRQDGFAAMLHQNQEPHAQVRFCLCPNLQ